MADICDCDNTDDIEYVVKESNWLVNKDEIPASDIANNCDVDNNLDIW